MPLVLKILFQRLLLGLMTLFILSGIIFFAIDALPGGFAEAVLGTSATPDTLAAFNREIGLDRPVLVRYAEWAGGVLKGDFGYSYAGLGSDIKKRSVIDLIQPRLYNTFVLAAVTASVAVSIALILGILAALYRNSYFDRISSSITLLAVGLPDFFVAYVLMFFFSIKLRWLSPLSTVDEATPIFDHLLRIVLPTATLSLIIIAHMMRMTRASIIEVLSSPFVEMARLKGLRPRTIILQHALPNAWAPIATVIAFNLAYLIAGVVVIEVVFVYPGLGKLMVDSVTSRDMPVVQACAIIFAGAYILLNLIADLIGILTNPRLLHPK